MKQNDYSMPFPSHVRALTVTAASFLSKWRGAGWGRAIKEEAEVQGRPDSFREDQGATYRDSRNAHGVFTRGWGYHRAWRACLGEKWGEAAGGLGLIFSSCPGQFLLTPPNSTATWPPGGPVGPGQVSPLHVRKALCPSPLITLVELVIT